MITVDAIKKISETDQIPLKWVGMEKIVMPVHLMRGAEKTNFMAEFDIFVNLVSPSKGIHMSRLYEQLIQWTQKKSLSLAGLRTLLKDLVGSQNGLSTQAKIALSLALPVPVRTLKSEKNYFKSLPLNFSFTLGPQDIDTELRFKLDYSSTCPQSAALAHQLTIAELEKQNMQSAQELTAWYAGRGFVATPHAQRSEVDLAVMVKDDFELSDFPNLLLGIESALGTPTQGIVKRVDEQEFARLNAVNLMFCEDAARRLTVFLKGEPTLHSGRGKVSHLESLHSHNAVAFFEFP